MTLAEKMVDFRARNAMSIEKAANIVGISAQTWRYVERGIQDPSRVTQRKIELLLEGKSDESEHNAD